MHYIVVDLGFGDCGKGTTVDYLCATRDIDTVVRFNGGAQAAHTVVLADGRKHTFAQFGSGSLRPGVRTHLSSFMVVDPLALVTEAEHLVSLGVTDIWDRLTVDAAALITTPYHRLANRSAELARGADRHGSCGMGVGATTEYALAYPDDALRAADCADPPVLRRKLAQARARLGVGGPPVEACLAAFTGFASLVRFVDRLSAAGSCVFEGAQGVLLDEWHGFHPYTTWSTTTFANALELLRVADLPDRSVTRLGVLRTVTTRHGAGPLPTEAPALGITDPNNPANDWQGAFRVGHFDAPLHRYALEAAGGVDGLVLTYLDLPVDRMCHAYDREVLRPGAPGDLDRQAAMTRALATVEPQYTPVTDWVGAVESELGAPVVLESWGPTAQDKKPTT
ncbi:adenylosuccinate synthetase [Dactylosporangium matsuzakiense]|uniref:Adenylosuccinate synthetase n=1 Tax=Dactylosporangium matsuzakiense TaxID=53360 RepID=A0A9W6NHZ2_9ACTN|nr:adenylosuccinate synthetase [Dactylosporangium matsuzakiense]GLK98374.1 adenylosuccinate synthetase [Dactylosporangium matsuzakiense]